MNNKFLLFFFVSFALSCQLRTSSQNVCVEQTVAAFDIGSGSTKLLVADRNSCTLRMTKVHLEEQRPVGFSQDLSAQSGPKSFSQTTIKQADIAIQELMALASYYEPVEIIGVATQAFRQASNAKKLIENWNQRYQANFRIISQQEEAKLAYLGVTAFEKDQNIVVWDIGGGSQQLSWMDENKTFHSYESAVASVTYKNELLKHLNREKVNPLSADDVVVAKKIIPQMMSLYQSDAFIKKIKQQPLVVGLGGVHGKSIREQLQLKDGQWVKRDHIERVISRQRLLTDEQIGGAFAQTQVSNLILILGLMDLYGLDQYKVREMSLSHSLILNPEF